MMIARRPEQMVNEIMQTMQPGKIYTAGQLAALVRKPLRDVDADVSKLCECGRIKRHERYTKDGVDGFERIPAEEL